MFGVFNFKKKITLFLFAIVTIAPAAQAFNPLSIPAFNLAKLTGCEGQNKDKLAYRLIYNIAYGTIFFGTYKVAKHGLDKYIDYVEKSENNESKVRKYQHKLCTLMKTHKKFVGTMLSSIIKAAIN